MFILLKFDFFLRLSIHKISHRSFFLLYAKLFLIINIPSKVHEALSMKFFSLINLLNNNLEVMRLKLFDCIISYLNLF